MVLFMKYGNLHRKNKLLNNCNITVNVPLPNSNNTRTGNNISRKNSSASNAEVVPNRTHSRNSSLDLRTVGRIPSQDQLRYLFIDLK